MKALKESGLFLNNSIKHRKRLAFTNATTAKKHGCLRILENHSSKAVKIVTDTFTPHTYGLIRKEKIIKKKL